VAVIQITPQMRVLVATEPVDFRRGIDGLAQVCRASLHEDPFTGDVFVFRSRQRKAIKLLVYDGQGFWLCHKRLSHGRFRYWPSPGEAGTAVLLAHEIQVLLSAGNPSATHAAPRWRKLVNRPLSLDAEEKKRASKIDTGGIASSSQT
jgi:transposase